MPASVADPVSLALRSALNGSPLNGGKKNRFLESNEEHADSVDILEERLAASTKRVMLSHVEYETVPKHQAIALDTLKSKYVLFSPSPASLSKNGTSVSNNTAKHAEELSQPRVVLFKPEQVHLGWKTQTPVGAGMVNMGNTCYLNSTLQALFHVPSLANWLLSREGCQCEQNDAQQRSCTLCAIAKTLGASLDKSGGVIKPILVYNRLKMICKHMIHGRQEDAHEFMRYLIESMERAFLQSVNGLKLDSRSKETNPLGQIFGGYIRTEVTCLKCRHVSTTFQHFQDIPLDIQHSSTLDEALGYYFRRERLEGDNAYKCEKCRVKVPATKKFSIEKPPQVLCIQLKRFNLFGGKLGRHVQFSRNINMQKFLVNPQQQQAPVNYKFISLINHMGPSQNCGHYTAMAEASNGQLYLFDDCSVRLVSLNTVLSTGAYVLIYERVNNPGPQSPIQPKASPVKIVNNPPQTKSPTTPRPTPVPKPAIIPDRPKITFGLNRPDSGGKPQLVISGGKPLLLKPAPLKENTVAPEVNGTSPSPLKPVSANGVLKKPANGSLVPYDSESDEEDDDPPPKIVPPQHPTTNSGNSTGSSPAPSKFLPRALAVSNLKKPTKNEEEQAAVQTKPLKWQVSDSSVQDSSSTTSSNCNRNKWLVTPTKEEPQQQAVPPPAAAAPAAPEKVPEKTSSMGQNQKWDGSRSSDTVKELLKMSHTGFDDHVRTWDGGKSHVTKEVEQDKRVQRKRTADELWDEELDKGKVKKVKQKEDDGGNEKSRDSSPQRGGGGGSVGANPFQQVQNDRNRERDGFQPRHHDNHSNGSHRSHHRHHQHRGGHQPHHRNRHHHHHPHQKGNKSSWHRHR